MSILQLAGDIPDQARSRQRDRCRWSNRFEAMAGVSLGIRGRVMLAER